VMGFGKCSALVELLSLCIDLLNANEGFAIASSLLSDGLLPFGITSVDILFPLSRGSAEGQSVVRAAETSWLRLVLDEAFESKLGRSNNNDVFDSLRDSSELAFLFSIISPPPAIMTGLIRSSRKGSRDVMLSWEDMAPLMLWSRPRPRPPALLLRPRPAAYLPYPSCPVPAAGPFLGTFSLLSTVGTFAGAVLVRRPKRPNLDFVLPTLGLGVRVACCLDDG
jgi:hypothetical protein